MGCCDSHKVESNESTLNSYPDDPKVLLGPVNRDRRCTDLGFFIYLTILTSFLIIGSCMAGARSNTRRLIYGYDDYGNLCGMKNEYIEGAINSGMDYTREKYLLINETCFEDVCHFKKKCYEKCPKHFQEWAARRCFNEKASEKNHMVLQHLLLYMEEAGSDISTCWQEILLSCLISIALSASLLVIFRCCGAVIVWGVLGFTTIALFTMTIFAWVVWSEKNKGLSNHRYSDEKSELTRKEAGDWLVVAITVTTMLVVFLVIMCCVGKKVKFVVALFEEAGKYIAEMPLLLVQPILTSAAVALTWCFLILTFIWVQTTGEPHVDYRGIVTFPVNMFFKIVGWCSLFGAIWMVQFILACQHVIVAGAVGLWYFTRDKNALNATGNPISISWKNLVYNHLGSTALGSFVIALLNFIRALVSYARQQTTEASQRCELSCCSCCLVCSISFLDFLFRNVYIMIALFGESFCKSARRAYNMFTANVMSVAAADSVGHFVFFVGCVGITILVALISLALIRPIDDVNLLWVPVIISCAFALLCSHCFLSVYRVTMDTLMICFCEDCQINDGVDKPYFMNRSLMVFMENNKQMRTTTEQPV